MAGYHFVLFSETPDVSPSDLYRLRGALEINGQHCAKAWRKEAPAIDVISERRRIPSGAHPIVFVDGSNLKGSGLANHYYDPIRRGPAARVYVGKATGFNAGQSSVAELASHELVEAIVDPMVNLWVDHPDHTRSRDTQMSLEIADMVQTQYRVSSMGDDWQMSNFVVPDYFRQWLGEDDERLAKFLAAGGRFDWSGELEKPGEIGPSGYAILRRPKSRADGGGWSVWPENRNRKRMEFTPDQGKSHIFSRTRLRGAVD